VVSRRIWFWRRRRSSLLGRAVRVVWSATATASARHASRTLARMPRPASPIAESWVLSPATLVGQYRVVPRLVVWRLGRFNRYGRVAIAPDRVGFDDKTVRWNRVIEVRTCQVTGRLPQAVLIHEATRLSKHLPRFPGRRRLAAFALARAAPLVMSTVGHLSGGSPATPTLPYEIIYRTRFGRSASLRAGLFAAAAMTAVPEAADSLTSTAEQRAIPVRPMPTVTHPAWFG
jgi:hypothetical protein